MPEEPPPIDPDEIILRRIPRVQYQADLPIPVQTGAFSPAKQDTDGLSFFRERIISTEAILRNHSRRPAENYVIARFCAQDLMQMGLSLTPTNEPDEPPGHVLIVELRRSAYEADKTGHRIIHQELARLGSQDLVTDIVS